MEAQRITGPLHNEDGPDKEIYITVGGRLHQCDSMLDIGWYRMELELRPTLIAQGYVSPPVKWQPVLTCLAEEAL